VNEFIGNIIKVGSVYFKIINIYGFNNSLKWDTKIERYNLLLGTNDETVEDDNTYFKVHPYRQYYGNINTERYLYYYNFNRSLTKDDIFKMKVYNDRHDLMLKYEDTQIEVVDHVANSSALQINKLGFESDMSRDIGIDYNRNSYTIKEFESEYSSLTMDNIINALCTYENLKVEKYFKNKCTTHIMKSITNKKIDTRIEYGNDYDMEKYDEIFDANERNIINAPIENKVDEINIPNPRLDNLNKLLELESSLNEPLELTSPVNSSVLSIVSQKKSILAQEMSNLSPELKELLGLTVAPIKTKAKPIVKYTTNIKTQLLNIINNNKVNLLKCNDNPSYKTGNNVIYQIKLDKLVINIEIDSTVKAEFEDNYCNYGRVTTNLEINACAGANDAGGIEKIILLRMSKRDKLWSYMSNTGFNSNSDNTLCNVFNKKTSSNNKMLGKGKIFQVYRGEVLKYVNDFVSDMMKLHNISSQELPKRISLHLNKINELIVNNDKGKRFDELLTGLNSQPLKQAKPFLSVGDFSKLESPKVVKNTKCIGFDMITYLRGNKNITIEESMKVFKFNSKVEITERKIKLRFNKMLKRYHSDIGGTDEDMKTLMFCRDILNKITK